jgi:hypothetical protein
MAIYKNTPPIVTSGSVLNIDAANWAQPVSRNLLNYSTDLTNASWSKTRCQITASAGTAPDGTNTAFAMTITDSTGLVRLTAASFTASVPGGPYTLSCYVKKNNSTAGAFQPGVYDSAQSVSGMAPQYAIQNNFIRSGSSIFGTSATVISTTTQDAGNGWYRVATSGILSSSISAFSVFFDIADAFGSNKVNGQSLLLWKPQFEAGIEATQPNDIPTTIRFAPDLSGNGNTGSFSTNRPTRTPNNGGSIAFLGSYTGYPTLTYAATPTLNISGSSMSGEVWVKFNRLDYTTSSGSLVYLYRKGNPDSPSPNNGVWLAYDNRANRSSFTFTCFGNSAGGFAGGGNSFGGSEYAQTFTTGSWNHIVFTINNSTGSFYINGLQKGPNKNFNSLDLYNTGSSSTGITIFDVVPPAPTPFEIGVFRLYNRALSQQEVFQNYNALKSRFNLS